VRSQKSVAEIKIKPPEDNSLFWGFYDITGKLMGGFIYRNTLAILLISSDYKLKYTEKLFVIQQVYISHSREVVDFIFERKQVEEALILDKLISYEK